MYVEPGKNVPRQVAQVTVWYYEARGTWQVEVWGGRRIDETGLVREHHRDVEKFTEEADAGDVLECAHRMLVEALEELARHADWVQLTIDNEPF